MINLGPSIKAGALAFFRWAVDMFNGTDGTTDVHRVYGFLTMLTYLALSVWNTIIKDVHFDMKQFAESAALLTGAITTAIGSVEAGKQFIATKFGPGGQADGDPK